MKESVIVSNYSFWCSHYTLFSAHNIFSKKSKHSEEVLTDSLFQKSHYSSKSTYSSKKLQKSTARFLLLSDCMYDYGEFDVLAFKCALTTLYFSVYYFCCRTYDAKPYFSLNVPPLYRYHQHCCFFLSFKWYSKH